MEMTIGRRDLLAGGLTLGALAVSGCGGDASLDDAPTSATRTFVDATAASIKVPDRPRRIVATHDHNGGAQLLSLGAPVIGVPTRDGAVEPAMTKYFDVDKITTIGEVYEPDIEAIAALRPDLIVHEATGGKLRFHSEGTVEALRGIAPVVAIDTFRPVEKVMADFARLVGGRAVAVVDQQKAEFDEEFGRLRAILGDRWREVTASVVYYFEGLLRAYGPHSLPETEVLSRLGVRWAAPVMAAGRASNRVLDDVSIERLREFDGDLVVLAGNVDRPLEKHPLYQNLAAVKAGQAIRIPSGLFGVHFPNLTALVRAYRQALTGTSLRTDIV
jgi:ABC-type Fe3+-hydroxamate transport system substrate-binding protein